MFALFERNRPYMLIGSTSLYSFLRCMYSSLLLLTELLLHSLKLRIERTSLDQASSSFCLLFGSKTAIKSGFFVIAEAKPLGETVIFVARGGCIE